MNENNPLPFVLSGVTRRHFVSTIALTAAGSFLLRRGMTAETFQAGDFSNLVPADKKLSDEWIKSLSERGKPTLYSGADLRYIGMPVGGICAGQLYLGGDGQLWHWDIFNDQIQTGAEHYKTPLVPQGQLEQGFAVRILSGAKPEIRSLNAKGFPGVTFCGQYPIGTVSYIDSACPLAVTMQSFSPFIPLDVDDSSLPATIFKFTVKNTSSTKIEAELGGWLENVVARKSGQLFPTMRTNRETKTDNALLLECGYRELPPQAANQERPTIVYDDFERQDWGRWKTSGEAFGSGPTAGDLKNGQKLAGFVGGKLANSFPARGDGGKGTLVSEPFTIERRFVNLLIGGGNAMRPDGQVDLGINLVIDGKVVRNATGSNSDTMTLVSWEVSELEGKTAHFEVVDNLAGGWAHIEVDQIEFSDRSPLVNGTGSEQQDVGSLTLGLLEPSASDWVNPLIATNSSEGCFAKRAKDGESAQKVGAAADHKFTGSVVKRFTLEPGTSEEITFVLAWYFPKLVFPFTFTAGAAPKPDTIVEKGRYYGTKFKSAVDVAQFIANNKERFVSQTEQWHDTWYDSTLPYWLLDRTLLNVSTLATSTCYRFADGRFLGWEGVGSCIGTCTHVWHYEQAMGRLFPELDILLRDRVDFNPKVAFDQNTGVIGHRGDAGRSQAVDGQAGTILRAYRDSLVSPDDAFLKRNWLQIKLATQWLMSLDTNKDGILDLPQSNTLDGTWYGQIPWITSLALAAVSASAKMAETMGDAAFVLTCKTFAEAGRANFVRTFWNGEYFEQIPDQTKLEHVGSYNGCEIDQVLGQGWAYQVGLGRVLPDDKTKAALAAIWKYNFAPDVGPFRAARPAGRWYALPGEAGTLMCSWPRGDKLRVTKGFDYYFNECMNGFEHQVAGHMIWEGTPGSELVQHGLAIERSVHDRYHASKRNPWNEVECGDHYARSMASYGVFLAVCGFEYNGPIGHIGFAPRLSPENFKAAFTAAKGWGSYSQKSDSQSLKSEITIKWGLLRLRTIALSPSTKPMSVTATANGKPLLATLSYQAGQCTVTLPEEVTLKTSESLDLLLKLS